LTRKEKSLNHLLELYEANSIEKRIDAEYEKIKFLKESFKSKVEFILEKKEESLLSVKKLLILNSPKRKFENDLKEISFIKKSFEKSMYEVILKKQNEIPEKEEFKRKAQIVLNKKDFALKSLFNAFETLNPQNREKEGFGEIVKNGKKISLNKIKIDDIFSIVNTTTKITAKAIEKETKCFAENISKKSKS
jgi:exodeoxyribonuclease VII large subunit